MAAGNGGGRRMPHVLTVAGSDSSAGAGIQADIKACGALGAYCSSVITAVTAQNTVGVQVHMKYVVLYFRDELFAMADIVTPNLKEASALLGGISLRTVSDMCSAAKSIHNLGPR
ncbi:hypothetical protein BHM03_00008889 [Ensete ventricosum]|uniref:Pyridoxamine kinase/Phosphomethylpyrimidine kinase domain-containing protein n=1 Tax=Ensete ventricosum TaxID=4639 RepID=A0A427B027_ENSVE|nr:hypothetical protein B296_00021105 [Ensete ventricosum]RZR82465.1 hypothetical protein BHM03_00008889 [Ensete ventricosum]